MLRLCVPLVACILVLPSVSAGTAEDPEIPDPEGDATPPLSSTPGAGDALDLTAVWFTEAAERFQVHWRVAGLAESGELDRFEYDVQFTGERGRMHTAVWRQHGEAVVNGGIWGPEGGRPCAHTESGGGKATLSFDEATSTITIDLPRSCLAYGNRSMDPGLVLRDLQAWTYQCGVFLPTNMCQGGSSTPDTADGVRDFVFTLGQAINNTTMTDDVGLAKSSPGAGVMPLIVALFGLVAVVASVRRRTSA